MPLVIEADANGDLVIPVSARPGTRYMVERTGEAFTARPEISRAEQWWAHTTIEERLAWLHDFFARMPPGPSLTAQAVKREDLY